MKCMQDEIVALKKKLLEEAESSLLQAHELADLRHVVACLKSVKPKMTDAVVMAQPEVTVSTTQTSSATFSLVSPVSQAQARRRAQMLDVTCMARSLVPEGADVCSVDTHVLRAALLKPAVRHVLSTALLMQAAVHQVRTVKVLAWIQHPFLHRCTNIQSTAGVWTCAGTKPCCH